MQTEQQIMQWLNAGLQALNQQNPNAAIPHLSRVLAVVPNEPNALFLQGSAKRLLGEFDEALSLMKRAVKTHSNPAQVHNSIGNVHKDMGNGPDAEKAYYAAIKAQDTYADAYFNLGILKQHEGAIGATEKNLLKAIELQPQNANFHNAIGLTYQDKKDLVAAEAAFKKAISLNNTYFKALHNLGALLRSLFRYEEALEALKRAIALAPRVIEPRYIVANIHYELGNFDSADEEYRKVIALQPDYADAHESLNKLYWEHGKTDLYAKSYAIGVKANPASADLCMNHLQALVNAERLEEGAALGSEYSANFPNHAGVHQQLGRIYAQLGNMEAASDSYAQAVKSAPESPSVRLSASQHLIQLGDYKAALTHLDEAEQQTPNNQEMWAYRGLCWRLLGDERHEWLNNFDEFVGPSVIEVPVGFASLDDFLLELKETLRLCHTTKQAPIDQTLRGGSQTHGMLLERPEPVFKALKEALHQSASDYIRRLPIDNTHPLCKRRSGSFDFAASWSVWLREGGFHVNHVHPLGWISSAFYVDVPDANKKARDNKEGWIKFGESALMLGNEDQAVRYVEPQPGLLALFPSYMWHGTVAYHDNADRITTPFDIVPT